MRLRLIGLIATLLLASSAVAAELSGLVQKATADVHAQPKFDAPKVATLPRGTRCRVAAQQGLWYALQMPGGSSRVTCASTMSASPTPPSRMALRICTC